jgi:hypothetical protein
MRYGNEDYDFCRMIELALVYSNTEVLVLLQNFGEVATYFKSGITDATGRMYQTTKLYIDNYGIIIVQDTARAGGESIETMY